jgi:hypothetical protein
MSWFIEMVYENYLQTLTMDWSFIRLANNGTDKSWKISNKQSMIYTQRVQVDGNSKLGSFSGFSHDKFNK